MKELRVGTFEQDHQQFSRCAKPAEAAILAGGGRFLTQGTAVQVFEAGIKERSVVIEFDGLAKAIEVYQSPAYQSALKRLEGAVERDVRFLEGVS